MKSQSPQFDKIVKQFNERNKRLEVPFAERLVQEVKKEKKIVYNLR